MKGDPLPQPQPFTAEEVPEAIRRCEIEADLSRQYALASDGEGEANAHRFAAWHHARLAATLAELDGLRKDKERLDWLDSKRILHIHGDAPGDFELSPRGMSLRAVIDREMEGRP